MRDVLSRADPEVPQGEGLYGNDDVLEVTQSKFPGKKDPSVWLVEFYAPCAPPLLLRLGMCYASTVHCVSLV